MSQHIELHQAQETHDGFADLGFPRSNVPRPDPQAERDVFEDAHVAKQGVVLKHESDLTFAHRLPGGIFSRAFVRGYALEVGLDPDETVQTFLEEYARADSKRDTVCTAQRPSGEMS